MTSSKNKPLDLDILFLHFLIMICHFKILKSLYNQCHLKFLWHLKRLVCHSGLLKSRATITEPTNVLLDFFQTCEQTIQIQITE